MPIRKAFCSVALLSALMSSHPAAAESTLRIAMTASDIPTATGLPNNGFDSSGGRSRTPECSGGSDDVVVTPTGSGGSDEMGTGSGSAAACAAATLARRMRSRKA